MASYDYYNNKPLPSPSPHPSLPPYERHYNAPSSPYESQAHLAPDRPPQGVLPISPFETVFDDHVYPASTHQSGASSQQHLPPHHQDTAYYGGGGLGRGPSPSPQGNNGMMMMHSSDDIPLQDRMHKDLDTADHVYEAPQPQPNSRKGRVRFGELGMFGANKNRIPFVVYTFTVVQIAVFIGTIVKNGKFREAVAPYFFPGGSPQTPRKEDG